MVNPVLIALLSPRMPGPTIDPCGSAAGDPRPDFRILPELPQEGSGGCG
jgi:hypothetical protein